MSRLLALLAALGLVLTGCGSSTNGTTAATEETTPAPPELVLEPRGVAGRDPFTTSVAVVDTTVEVDATLASAPTVAGDQPGLYGGTRDEQACDAAALTTFLQQNPDKAAAWAGVLGIAPSGIADYLTGLTPVVLRTDTRVTNHGFADGVATPRQAVLQAGTAVMVDHNGVPRVRCSCGNPLTEPAPLEALPTAVASGSITLVGERWSGWEPQLVVTVVASAAVDQFEVWDLVDGGTFPILIGGAPVTTTTTEPPTTTTTRPPTTTTTTTAAPAYDCRNDPEFSNPNNPGHATCDPATGQKWCFDPDDNAFKC
jgi:hypothetical protein